MTGSVAVAAGVLLPGRVVAVVVAVAVALAGVTSTIVAVVLFRPCGMG